LDLLVLLCLLELLMLLCLLELLVLLCLLETEDRLTVPTVQTLTLSGRTEGPTSDRPLTAVFSFRQDLDTSAQWVGTDGQILCQFAANSSFGCSAKNELKCGDFLSRKPKVVVFRKFGRQCGGFMLFTRLPRDAVVHDVSFSGFTMEGLHA
jgi:hypothetical protein